jgi:FKBP-type peptidyl-prolyl cis-trans isomerase 2
VLAGSALAFEIEVFDLLRSPAEKCRHILASVASFFKALNTHLWFEAHPTVANVGE